MKTTDDRVTDSLCVERSPVFAVIWNNPEDDPYDALQSPDWRRKMAVPAPPKNPFVMGSKTCRWEKRPLIPRRPHLR